MLRAAPPVPPEPEDPKSNQIPYPVPQVHPYTSWIPITLWCVLRNLVTWQRLHHLRLYGWLGCITLETYIGQFHVWLKTSIPDGQPKSILGMLPGYPLLNFALTSAGVRAVLLDALPIPTLPHRSEDDSFLNFC